MEKKSNLVAAVCITNKNKVLILKQSYNSNFYYTLPGGHIENKETLFETAIRESKEGIGLVPKITGILKFGFISEFKRDTFFIIFEAKIQNKDKIEIDNNEIVDYYWASKDELENKYKDLKWRLYLMKQIAIDSLNNKVISVNFFDHLIKNEK
jgi:8-oxo-dGTP diphosphatase